MWDAIPECTNLNFEVEALRQRRIGGGGSYSTARGLGGTGGGGNGALDGTAGSAGSANTGGGGGGGNNNNTPSGSVNGYAGGSGIVIIRYAI